MLKKTCVIKTIVVLLGTEHVNIFCPMIVCFLFLVHVMLLSYCCGVVCTASYRATVNIFTSFWTSDPFFGGAPFWMPMSRDITLTCRSEVHDSEWKFLLHFNLKVYHILLFRMLIIDIQNTFASFIWVWNVKNINYKCLLIRKLCHIVQKILSQIIWNENQFFLCLNMWYMCTRIWLENLSVNDLVWA